MTQRDSKWPAAAICALALTSSCQRAIGVIGVGPTRAHRNTEAAIEQLAPSCVVMVGIAGGVAQSLRVGDCREQRSSHGRRVAMTAVSDQGRR